MRCSINTCGEVRSSTALRWSIFYARFLTDYDI
nr:MAG TPA: hypothetical protein [Caudoviricetes sp.]